MRAMGLLCSFGRPEGKRFMWNYDDLIGGRSWRFTVWKVQVTFFTQSRKSARRWDGPRAVASFTVDDLVWNSLDASEDFSGFHFGPPVELRVAPAEGWTYYWQADDPPPEDLVSRLWWAVRTWRQIWKEKKAQRMAEESVSR